MRLHDTEVDLSWHARPHLPTEEEWHAEERIAEIERTHEVRGARELTIVSGPVRQGNTELFDAQRSLSIRQGAKGVRSANESVGTGRRRRGQQTADPLSKHGPPGCFGHSRAKQSNPVCEPINGPECRDPAFGGNRRTGGRYRIELSPVLVCPCDDDIVTSQSDQCLGGHRSVIGCDAACHFAPSSSQALE